MTEKINSMEIFSSRPRSASASLGLFSSRPRLGLTFIAFFILAALCLTIFSQDTTISPVLNAGNTTYGYDQYVRAALAAAALMAGLMVLVFLTGVFIQNEEIKTFAKTEFLQVGASVILAAVLLGLLLAADTALRLTADPQTGIVSPCIGQTMPTSPIDMTKATLLTQYAYCYMHNLNDMAIAQGDTTIRKSIELTKKAYKMEGYQSDLWWLLYSGMTRRPDANLRLDSEIKGQEFDLLTKYMISLQGQLMFLQYIVPLLSPALLFLGIIFRSLYFTRKLGGLLLAAGVGLLLVWPACYLLSWFTLQVSVFGPSVMGDAPDSTCPASCKILPPTGYVISGVVSKDSWGGSSRISTDSPYYAHGALSQNDMLAAGGTSPPSIGDEAAWKVLPVPIQTCYPSYPKKTDPTTGTVTYLDPKQPTNPAPAVPVAASDLCPAECRFLPTPVELGCDLKACDQVPLACKAIRAMNLSTTPLPNPPDGCMQCNENVCPSFCKTILPQVKYSNPANPAEGVVPTTDANSCSVGTGDCTQCPLYCRSYNSKTGVTTISYDTPDCKAGCQACMVSKVDTSTPSPTNLPDCMLGIPSAMTECNGANACGAPMHLDAAIASGQTNICPIECRVNFDSPGENAYKDGVFTKYCEGTFATACGQSCPSTCKVKASKVVGSSSPFSLGVPTNFEIQNEAGTLITCAKAPTFDSSGKMDATVDGNCARCPMSCRLKNPSSILDLTKQKNYFLSASHYALECDYFNGTSSGSPPNVVVSPDILTYDGSCPDAINFPAGWKKFESELPAGTASGAIGRAPPDCAPSSPTSRIYLRQEKSDPLCPPFIVPVAPYIQVGSLKDTSPATGSGISFSVIVPPNPDVSAECSTPDAQKYCADSYCSDSLCKPDRAKVGPFFCQLSDMYNSQSAILSNEKNCTSCYTDTGDHTTGPQCQVLISTGSGNAKIPVGCSAACDPGNALDPKTKPANSCNGFCYPKLNVPAVSSSNCGPYRALTATPNNRQFANCAACPTDCRYDYNASGSAARNASENARCGWSYTPSANGCLSSGGAPWDRLNKTDKDSSQYKNIYPTGCTVKTWTSGSHIWVLKFGSIGTSADEGTGCGAAWYIPSYNSLCTDDTLASYWAMKGSDSKFYDENTTEDKSTGVIWHYCRVQSLSSESSAVNNVYEYVSTNDPTLNGLLYQCTPPSISKYPALDALINGHPNDLSVHPGDYHECGDLNMRGANPNLNLCGTKTFGTKTVTLCQDDRTNASSCFAHYNALNVSCLPNNGVANANAYTNNPKNNPTTPTTSCQNCPLFCRIDTGTSTPACTPWTNGGAPPQCESPNQCDISTSAPSTGVCGIPQTAFKIGSGCQEPTIGSGVGCPARCRISTPGVAVPDECTGGEIGAACARANLDSACTATPPDNPCAGCASCDTDCRSTPLVRQSCDELCLPTDFGNGGSPITPKDMLMSWEGAEGNPDWRSLGSLGIAAFLLPIFNIVLTLAFIRTLSPVLGGDIEIPGLMKVL